MTAPFVGAFRPRRQARIRRSSNPVYRDGRWTGEFEAHETAMTRVQEGPPVSSGELSREMQGINALAVELDALLDKRDAYRAANDGYDDPALAREIQTKAASLRYQYQVAQERGATVFADDAARLSSEPALLSDGSPNVALAAQWTAEREAHEQLSVDREVARMAARHGVSQDRAREIIASGVQHAEQAVSGLTIQRG